jgi:hypothetical protein
VGGEVIPSRSISFCSYASTSYEERTFGVRYTVGIPVVAAGAEMEEVVAVQLER